MTQEEKSLLLKDLCARLPYGVKCKWEHEYEGKTYTGGGILCDIDHVKTPNGYRYWDCYFEDEDDDIPIELVKPYLRSMASMTEKERKHWRDISLSRPDWDFTARCLDWLNSRHFDYRGLLERGLALEATEEMYKF